MLDEEKIDEVICEIMHQDGPDRHIDGHEVITEFVMSLLHNKGGYFESSEAEQWISDYKTKKNDIRFII